MEISGVVDYGHGPGELWAPLDVVNYGHYSTLGDSLASNLGSVIGPFCFSCVIVEAGPGR